MRLHSAPSLLGLETLSLVCFLRFFKNLASIKDLGERHPCTLYPLKLNTTSARGLLPPLEDLEAPDLELLAIAPPHFLINCERRGYPVVSQSIKWTNSHPSLRPQGALQMPLKLEEHTIWHDELVMCAIVLER